MRAVEDPACKRHPAALSNIQEGVNVHCPSCGFENPEGDEVLNRVVSSDGHDVLAGPGGVGAGEHQPMRITPEVNGTMIEEHRS
jgi:hypothetical protein